MSNEEHSLHIKLSLCLAFLSNQSNHRHKIEQQQKIMPFPRIWTKNPILEDLPLPRLQTWAKKFIFPQREFLDSKSFMISYRGIPILGDGKVNSTNQWKCRSSTQIHSMRANKKEQHSLCLYRTWFTFFRASNGLLHFISPTFAIDIFSHQPHTFRSCCLCGRNCSEHSPQASVIPFVFE